jgi:hypothetical protein
MDYLFNIFLWATLILLLIGIGISVYLLYVIYKVVTNIEENDD